MGFNIGDRVVFVNNLDLPGTVTSEVYSGDDDAKLQDVKWDFTDNVTAWDPFLYAPAGSKEKDIPEKIIASGILFVKGEGVFVFDDDETDEHLDTLDLVLLYYDLGLKQ